MFFKGRWGGKCRKERDRTKKVNDCCGFSFVFD